MRKLFVVLIAAFVAMPARAAWDPTKPSEASPTRQSSEIRANWDALATAMAGVNIVADNTFLLWPSGDAANPALWSLASTAAGQTVGRTGVGLADTTQKIGDFSAKVTNAAVNDAILLQQILGSSATSELVGLSVSCGAYVLASTADRARLCVYAKTGAGKTCSTFHTGNGQWQWLTVTQEITTTPDVLQVRFELLAPGPISAYISAPTCLLGSVPPSYPQPSGWQNFVIDCYRAGAQTTGTDKVDCHRQSPFYGIVQGVSLYAGTAPTGQALIVDLNTWDGAAYTSMFSTRPQIAAAASRSVTAEPDSTYARRCLVPQHGTTLATDGELSLDVDQVGSGAAGSDLHVQIRGLRVARPLQQFLGSTE